MTVYIAAQSFAEVDVAVLAELRVGFAGFGIDRIEPFGGGAEEDPFGFTATPIGDSAQDSQKFFALLPGQWIESPQFFAADRIQSTENIERRGVVEYTIGHQRCTLVIEVRCIAVSG